MKKRLSNIYLTTLLLLTFALVGCGEANTKIYSVTLVYDELVHIQSVEEGTTINFEPLDKENYLFFGWFNEDYSTCFDNQVITSDITLYAKLIKKGIGYNVTLDLNGGELVGKNVKRYTVGTEKELPQAKKEPNFEFIGWKYNDTVITSISDTTYGDITLVAEYIDHNTYCKIEYELDGGTLSDSPLTTYRVGDTNPISTYAKKEGYYFKGWYLDEEFKTKVTSITPDYNTNLKLYAKYAEKTAANTTISFLGDSITTFEGTMIEGYGTYYPQGNVTTKEATWWYQVANNLGYTILRNNSYSGSRVTTNVFGLPNIEERIPLLGKDGENPDILIIHMGTNDYANGVSVAAFTPAFKNMLDLIYASYDDVKIYVCLHNTNNYPEKVHPVREQFNEALISICNEYGITYLDLREAITDENVKSMMFANAHPNANGMKTIADYITDKLR